MAAAQGDGVPLSVPTSLLKSAAKIALDKQQQVIHHTEAQLRSALQELELARQQEARRLAATTDALRLQHERRMATLERRFLTEAEALQVQLSEAVEREAQRSQAALDARVAELLGVLGACGGGGGIGAPGCSVGSGLTSKAATAGRAPPAPAVAAATEAIAALRMGLTPSAGKACVAAAPAGAQGACKPPAFSLAAASGSAARPASAPPVRQQAPSFAVAPLACPSPARHGMPNTAAAARASLLASPQRVHFAGQPIGSAVGSPVPAPQRDVKPASEPARRAVTAPAAAPTAAVSMGGGGGEGGEACRHGQHPQLEHDSSSEWEDDSYLCEESSGEVDRHTGRPPLVKTVNPGGTPRASFSAPSGAAAASPFAAARPGSVTGRGVHLNVTGGGGSRPGSPPRTAHVYSSCACFGSPGGSLHGARYSSD